MIEHADYPKELEDFDIKDSVNQALNMGVWDFESGAILKLAEGKEIVQAYRHGKKMTKDEICAQWGSPPIFNKIDYPNKVKSDQPNGFTAHPSYFDCCRIPLIMRIMKLVNDEVINKTPHEVYQDIKGMILRQYAHYDANQVYSIKTYGDFFPAVYQNPGRFIQK